MNDFDSGSRRGTHNTAGSFASGYVTPDTGGNPMGLVKLGERALTLSGEKSFSGGVEIDAGTLNVNSNAALGYADALVIFSGDATPRFPTGFTLEPAGSVARKIRVAHAKAITIFFLIVLANLAGFASASTLQIPLVTVGDPGNAASVWGYGSVSYVYQIGEYDVTVGQYCQFLNAVATAGDPYGLYSAGMATDMPTVGITQTGNGGYAVQGNASMPMFDVNWGDAARFVNWLANGQPTGAEGRRTTETGTYPLNGATSNAALMAVSRSTTGSWVLPTVNEWYKAAYYSGDGTNSAYWLYATQSNTTPSNLLSATGTNNANFVIADNGPPNYGFTDYTNFLTTVGTFAACPSAYGTYDQNGDVYQWNETAYGGTTRGLVGGAYGDAAGEMLSTSNGVGGTDPAYEDSELGFRVAYVPEPGSISLLLAAAMVLSAIRLFLSVMERSMRRWVIMSFAMKAAWARRSFRKAARAPRYARKDWFARQKWYARQRWHPKRQRHAKRWRPRFESLSVECLEPRRLLTPVYWDGSTAGGIENLGTGTLELNAINMRREKRCGCRCSLLLAA